MKSVFIFLMLYSFLFSDVITPLPQEVEYDQEKMELGRELFFDPILSQDETISCASCHSVFGSDDKKLSIGIKGQKGDANSLSVFNAVYNFGLFWNGRAENLKIQAEEPVHNPFEMGIDSQTVEKRLKKSSKYKILFRKAYNQNPSFDLAMDAIAEFEKTLITPNAKFDRYLRGETELTQQEAKGYENFKTLGCISCHNGRNVGGNSYHKFGNLMGFFPYEGSLNDRFAVTKNIKDQNVFRVPSLRNVTKTAPYFHNGSVEDLESTVAIMGYYNLGIDLNEKEINSIVAFLKTLDGELPKTWKVPK